MVKPPCTTARSQAARFRHRLERYGAGRRMDFDSASPDLIAEAIGEEIWRDVTYRDVESDGAARAARHLAELL